MQWIKINAFYASVPLHVVYRLRLLVCPPQNFIINLVQNPLNTTY